MTTRGDGTDSVDPERTAGPTRPGRNRKLLLVSWHFGTSGATGGFRWAHMTRHLAALGWSFEVLTSEQSNDPDVQGVRVHVVPPVAGVERLAGHAGALASRIKRLLRWIRGFARDPGERPPNTSAAAAAGSVEGHRAAAGATARLQAALHAAPLLAWNRRAVRRGLTLSREAEFEAVIVSSPPHLTLLAGVELGKRLDIPFVADLRDAWVAGLSAEARARLPTPHRILGERHEVGVNRSARLILHNTEEARAAAAAALPAMPVRRAAVRNGHDGGFAAEAPDSKDFRVLFSGWIYDHMDLPALLGGFGRFLRRRKPGDSAILEFQGAPDRHRGMEVTAFAAAAGIPAPHLHFSPRAPRKEALAAQMRASLLVAFDCVDPICVPMKVYDYACMQGELLLLGHPEGAMATVAAEIGRSVVSPTDDRGVDAAFDEAYGRWLRTDWRGPHDPHGALLRHRQSTILAGLLDELTSPAPAGEPA